MYICRNKSVTILSLMTRIARLCWSQAKLAQKFIFTFLGAAAKHFMEHFFEGLLFYIMGNYCRFKPKSILLQIPAT